MRLVILPTCLFVLMITLGHMHFNANAQDAQSETTENVMQQIMSLSPVDLFLLSNSDKQLLNAKTLLHEEIANERKNFPNRAKLYINEKDEIIDPWTTSQYFPGSPRVEFPCKILRLAQLVRALEFDAKIPNEERERFDAFRRDLVDSVHRDYSPMQHANLRVSATLPEGCGYFEIYLMEYTPPWWRSGASVSIRWDISEDRVPFSLENSYWQRRKEVYDREWANPRIVYTERQMIHITKNVNSFKAMSAAKVLQGHHGYINSAVFSSNGRKVLTSSDDKTARIWDVETGKELQKLEGHIGSVRSGIFSPDGKKVVTSSGDKTARIWDVETGKVLHVLAGHTDEAIQAVFSPDGKKIVTGSADGTARIWDVETGKVLQELAASSRRIFCVTFSPDCKKVAAGNADRDPIKIWVTETGKELLNLKGHESTVSSIVFSLDGKKIVTGSHDKTARIWDAETGKELHKLEGHTREIVATTFSPDGKNVLTCGSDRTARIWDTESGNELQKLEGHKDVVMDAVWSPDGTKILSGSHGYGGVAWIWDVETGNVLHELAGHRSWIKCVAFSPDGKQALTSGGDKTARIWDWDQFLPPYERPAKRE